MVFKVALKQAASSINNDIRYRLWVASIGGIYADAAKVKPNPHLAFLPQRDLFTSEGIHLTLINPAYMLRLVYKFAETKLQTPINVKITGLKPKNPQNAPDEWEQHALKIISGKTSQHIELITEKKQTIFKSDTSIDCPKILP